jgi:hypothetical protein
VSVKITGWFVGIFLAIAAVRGVQAQTAETFAQRLATAQTTKRAVDIAAVRAAPANKILYVRTTGNDSNNGTATTRAVRTIQRAINLVQNPGTFIVVGAGTYAETLTFTAGSRSGTPGNQNTIFADVTGVLTGDAAGAVVVSGTGGRAYGLTMQSCSNWSFRWLTFSGQTTGNVYIVPTPSSGTASVGGLVFDACTFNVTPNYGFLAHYIGNLTVNDCTFARTVTSGHCLYVYTISATTLTVTNNRVNRTGSLYDTSGFKSGTFSSGPGGGAGNSTYAYGLIVMATGATPTAVTVQNNIVSDTYLGVYTYTLNGNHTIRVANNSVVSSYYGLYTYGQNSGSAVVSNNLIGNCYIGSYTYLPQGSIVGQMEWNINYLTVYPSFASTYTTSYRRVASSTGFVTNLTPAFVSASTGDFTLNSGSAGIDTGVATHAPSTDAAGVARPIDGNGDGTLAVDLGAVEAPLTRRLRVTRWELISAYD